MLTNFYLFFNTIVPYYDDVILSLSITSFKNIVKNSKIKFKENRLMQLIYSLNDNDRIVVDDDGIVYVDYYIDDDNTVINDDDEVAEVEDDVPITEPTTEPITEPITEPTTEPITELTTEPITELTTEPECYNSLEKKNN
jgi:hypothetical protein